MKFWRLKAAIVAALLLAPGWALAGNNADGKFNNIIGNALVVGGNTVTLGGNFTTSGALNFTGAGSYVLPAPGTLLNTSALPSGSTSQIYGATGAAGTATPLSTLPSAVQAGITQLGIITSGTWQGANVGLLYGGTGASTAAGARVNLGAAALGANGDITSLTGLTTALPASEGGLGATSLTGYLYGNGTGAATSSATIPASAITGLSGIYAPLASPTFTGSPVVPGYLTNATAALTYAPLASPALTGTPTIGGNPLSLGGAFTTNGADAFSGAGNFVLPPSGTIPNTTQVVNPANNGSDFASPATTLANLGGLSSALAASTYATLGANSNITSLSAITNLSSPTTTAMTLGNVTDGASVQINDCGGVCGSAVELKGATTGGISYVTTTGTNSIIDIFGNGTAQTRLGSATSPVQVQGTINLGATPSTSGKLSTQELYYSGASQAVVNNGCSMECGLGYFTGTVAGTTSLSSITEQDEASSGNIIYGWQNIMNVAPLGSTASGSVTGLQINVGLIGSLQGGTITSGSAVAFSPEISMQSSEGGSVGNYQGNGWSIVNGCSIYSTASYVGGCDAQEIDIQAFAGSIYARDTPLLIADNAQAQGQLGPDRGIVVGTGNNNYPLATIRSMVETGGSNAIDPQQGVMLKLIPINPDKNGTRTQEIGGAIDADEIPNEGFASRYPYEKTVAIEATGVTTSSRLTSDGNSPTSYIFNVDIINNGSAYTTAPTFTVTGCSAVINATLGSGGALSDVGVYSTPTNCPSNTSATASAGPGVTAVVALEMEGNTLNFPINTMVQVSCSLTAENTLLTEELGETITFVATQGATPSTVTILGSPTWTLVSSVGSPTITFGVPQPDTTLGAIKMSEVSSAGTWNLGGTCKMVSPNQVL